MTLPQNPIDTSKKEWKDITNDLQCNIIKHHGRENAFHLFFEITNVKQFKKDIKQINLKTALQQIVEAGLFKKEGKNGGTIITISFSAKGFEKIKTTPQLSDSAFASGMQSRSILSDNINDWDKGLIKEQHVLIIVADDDANKLIAAKNDIIQLLKNSTNLNHLQKGEILRNENGIGIEHFGYADGISQPVYLKEEFEAVENNKIWNDAADADNLLVKDNNGKVIGSYFVFRKLEQNVVGFKAAEKSTKDDIIITGQKHLCPVKDVHGWDNKELPGAMTVGRFEDGTETVNYSIAKGITAEADINNDFDYNVNEMAKCPFHAHIRLTNPRSDVGNQDIAKSIRITRRGIPYNDIGRNVNDLDNDQPSEGVGLLFMCYQRSIEGQFEIIQGNWANNGQVGNNPLRGMDGIIGQGDNRVPQELPSIYGDESSKKIATDFSGFVTTKGGEYFFTPMISFIKSL
jgi:Dyp-type peroxidase family